MAISTAPALILIACTCGAALMDIRERRIANWLVLLVAAIASIASLVAGGWIAFAMGVVHAIIALLVGMLLFRFGLVGGGDAKLYSAVALAIPIERALVLLGWTSLGGILLLAIMAIGRKLSNEPIMPSAESRWAVPYGVAIFIGLVGAIV